MTSSRGGPLAAFHYFTVFRGYLGASIYFFIFATLVVSLMESLGIIILIPVLSAFDGDAALSVDHPISEAFRSFLALVGADWNLQNLLILIVAIFVAKGAIIFVANWQRIGLNARFQYELKASLFKRYESMSYSYYVQRGSAHFVNVIGGQLGKFQGMFNHYSGVISQFVLAVTYLFFATFISWQFAALACLVAGVMFLLLSLVTRRLRAFSFDSAKEEGRLNRLMLHTIQSYKYLSATGQFGRYSNGVKGSIRRVADLGRRSNVLASVSGVLKEPVAVVCMVPVVSYSVFVMDQPIAPILVSLLLFNRCFYALMGMLATWQTMEKSVGAMDLVTREVEQQELNRQQDGQVEIGRLADGLRFENVSYTYPGKREPAIRDLTLTIPACSTVGIVGPSGAGKSTFLDLLAVLLRPSAGRILIDGTDTADLRLASWRTQIGYVPQEPVLFDDSVASNITMRATVPTEGDPDWQRMVEAARLAGAAQFVEDLEEGYLTRVGDRGISFSGGQRQRICLARELFRRPSLLILDEATSALDVESERFVKESIATLEGSMTIVIVAHRLSTILDADRIFVVERGSLIEEGSYAELRAAAGVFDRMMALQ